MKLLQAVFITYSISTIPLRAEVKNIVTARKTQLVQDYRKHLDTHEPEIYRLPIRVMERNHLVETFNVQYGQVEKFCKTPETTVEDCSKAIEQSKVQNLQIVDRLLNQN